MIGQLRSFHRRRVAIEVGPDDLVLDIGSGDKPHWRADVLLDRFVDATHADQRSGGASALVSRPLFASDATAMPFADHAFDYAICSHMLEHVPDPSGVIRELQRVARAGYIEVPFAGAAKIQDFPTHLWWCSVDAGTLVFRTKESKVFDADIDAFVRSGSVEADVRRLLVSNFERAVVSLPWDGSIPHRVEGSPSATLLDDADRGAFDHRRTEMLVSKVLVSVLTLPRRRQRRSAPVMFNDVVAPEHRHAVDEPLRREVYRL